VVARNGETPPIGVIEMSPERWPGSRRHENKSSRAGAVSCTPAIAQTRKPTVGVSKPAQGLLRPRRVVANTAARRRWIVATVDIVGGDDAAPPAA